MFSRTLKEFKEFLVNLRINQKKEFGFKEVCFVIRVTMKNYGL